MTEKTHAQRFRHHFLLNGAILTICTELEYSTRKVKVGWAIFNPNDSRWVRRIGNQIASYRLNNSPLEFILSPTEPVLCDYISMQAIVVIFINCKNPNPGVTPSSDHPSSIPTVTRQAMQIEIARMVDLIGRRVSLPPISLSYV